MQPGSGPVGAQRWESLREARRTLRAHPDAGSESVEHPGHRQLVVSGYRIVYSVHPDTGDGTTAGDVRVVAVFGPGQA